ncbi:MAG: ferritin-like domain-containing protein [Myxococcales bacterium]|nr:ferritin-like domain-containing protein [Myxococcales bacterium]
MIDAVRGLLVRATAPLVWRLPGHAPRKLEAFARAEEGSRIDLLAAAHATPSLARRARYLRHALDETRHAAMFTRRAAELRAAGGLAPTGPPRADTEALFARLGELGFLAFVHRGERRGRRQFEVYARTFARRGDARTQALFTAILADERDHEAYTLDLLRDLSPTPAAAARALRRAGWWQAWRTWRRAGRALAHALYAVAMTAVYLVMAPLAWLPLRRRARATRRRWLPSPAVVSPAVVSPTAVAPAPPAEP